MNGKFNTAFAVTCCNLENDSKASKQNNTHKHTHTHTKMGHECYCFLTVQRKEVKNVYDAMKYILILKILQVVNSTTIPDVLVSSMSLLGFLFI